MAARPYWRSTSDEATAARIRIDGALNLKIPAVTVPYKVSHKSKATMARPLTILLCVVHPDDFMKIQKET
jgi:hypothetical protein